METPPGGRRGSNSLVLPESPVVLLPLLPEALLLVAEPVMVLLSVSEPFEVPVLFAVPDVLDCSSLLLSLLLSLVGVALALDVFSLALVLLAEVSLLSLLLTLDEQRSDVALHGIKRVAPC
jgi:hypothetical protein